MIKSINQIVMMSERDALIFKAMLSNIEAFLKDANRSASTPKKPYRVKISIKEGTADESSLEEEEL